MNNNITLPQNGVIKDLCQIIEQGRRQAYASANQIVIQTYWNIGRRIVEEEQHGEQRAVVFPKVCLERIHSSL